MHTFRCSNQSSDTLKDAVELGVVLVPGEGTIGWQQAQLARTKVISVIFKKYIMFFRRISTSIM
jgi:hypothetical protein